MDVQTSNLRRVGLGWVGFDDKDTDVTDEIVNSLRLSFNGQVLLTSPFVKK